MRSFSLLETMRLDTGRVRRRERHLARMAGAATHFGFKWDETAVSAALDAAARAHPHGLWRVRLLLAEDGTPTVECTTHVDDPDRTWRLALAERAVDAGDVFLRYKTTNRGIYDRARAARPDVDDVVLWNERGEITESTIGNIVVELDGIRYTPPLSCGLLGGAFRSELLDAEQVRERTLTKEDLSSAARIWLINSLREWVPAVLVP